MCWGTQMLHRHSLGLPNRRLSILSISIPLQNEHGGRKGHSQNVRLMTILCGPKYCEMLQSVFGNTAYGSGQLFVFTLLAPLFTSLGMLLSFRAQYHTLMKLLVRSIAYTPPPIALNCGPNEFGASACTPHPLFPSQSLLPGCLNARTEPDEQAYGGEGVKAYPDMPETVLGMVHPAAVCSVLWFGSWLLTPSMMSVSPWLGQSTVGSISVIHS